MVYGNHAITEKEDFISLIKEAQDKIDTMATENAAAKRLRRKKAQREKDLAKALGKAKSPPNVESNRSSRKRSRSGDPLLM